MLPFLAGFLLLLGIILTANVKPQLGEDIGMNLVGSHKIRNKTAQIIPLARGAILSEAGEYARW